MAFLGHYTLQEDRTLYVPISLEIDQFVHLSFQHYYMVYLFLASTSVQMSAADGRKTN